MGVYRKGQTYELYDCLGPSSTSLVMTHPGPNPPLHCNIEHFDDERCSEQRVNSRYRCRSPLDVHTTASVVHNAIAPLRRAVAVWDWRSDAMRNVCGPARFCLENNPTVRTAPPLSIVPVSLTVPV
ncbi:unnamed protein product [Boreogadus saida]